MKRTTNAITQYAEIIQNEPKLTSTPKGDQSHYNFQEPLVSSQHCLYEMILQIFDLLLPRRTLHIKLLLQVFPSQGSTILSHKTWNRNIVLLGLIFFKNFKAL